MIPFPIRTLDFGIKGGEKLSEMITHLNENKSSRNENVTVHRAFVCLERLCKHLSYTLCEHSVRCSRFNYRSHLKGSKCIN